MAEAKLIPLHRDDDNEEMWINAANIERVEAVKDTDGTYGGNYTLVRMTNEKVHSVRETPQQIAQLVNG